MNGHSTGAWSEVIRHVDAGAFAGAHPRARLAAPAAAYRNSRASWAGAGGGGGQVVAEVGQ